MHTLQDRSILPAELSMVDRTLSALLKVRSLIALVDERLLRGTRAVAWRPAYKSNFYSQSQ